MSRQHPGLQKSVAQWPARLCLEVLRHYFTYFGGPECGFLKKHWAHVQMFFIGQDVRAGVVADVFANVC